MTKITDMNRDLVDFNDALNTPVDVLPTHQAVRVTDIEDEAFDDEDLDEENIADESEDDESDESEDDESEEIDDTDLVSKESLDLANPTGQIDQTVDEFAQSIWSDISLGSVKVLSNTDQGGLVRFVPISRKDNGKKMYVVMNNMKNQIYLKENKIRYPSGKTYTEYYGRVKPDSPDVEIHNPGHEKKKYMVDVFNNVRRKVMAELRGYIKVPDVQDQDEFRFTIHHKFERIHNVLGYHNRTFTLKKDLVSHILRDCVQRYVIHLEGVKITPNRVYLVMRLCRTMVDSEIITQLRFYDTQLKLSKIVNDQTKKNLDRLRKTERVNLKYKRYAKKSDVKKKLEKLALKISISDSLVI